MKRFLLTLLLALSIGVGAALAESYKIEFQSGNNSYAMSSTTKPTTVMTTETSSNVKSFAITGSVYYKDTYGIRLGKSGGTGEVTITVADNLKTIVPSAIRIKAPKYNTDTGKLKVTACGIETELTPGADEQIITLSGNTVALDNIKLASTSKRVHLAYIIVEYTTGSVAVENLTLSPLEFDVYDEKTLTVTPEDFVSGVTELSFTSNEAVAYFTQGENNTIEALAFSAGETDLTLSWSDGSKYSAGTQTFKVKVNTLKPTLSYSAATCEVVLEEESYNFPTLTADTKGLTVVYSSSDEEVAMIDENNGGVKLKGGVGTTTITAKIEAVAGKNEGAEASYVLTVKPAGPLAAPVFEPVSGTYELSEIVSISAPSGATIYYGIGTTKADATEVYTEEFMLETLGEVTYVAYAKKDDRESDIVTVTYNVVKETAVFEFNAAAGETVMGSLLDIDALLNNPKELEYTLSTDNADVARVAINNPKHIWLMGAGVVNITATPVSTDYTATATTYALTVKEEVGEPVSVTTTFDFATNNYGMEVKTASNYNETKDVRSIEISHDSDANITITTSSIINATTNTLTGTRLWKATSGQQFRITKSNYIIVNAGAGINITAVKYVDANKKNATINVEANQGIWKITATEAIYMTSLTVTYTKPGEPAHCYAKLSMGDEREALVKATTIVDAATVENDATALVEYVVLDENGAVSDEVEAVAVDGKLEITTISENEGDYTILAFIDPYNAANAKYYAQVAEVPLYVRSMITPAELYIHGHFYNRYYDLTNPVKMEKNGRVFTANDILIGGNEEHADDNFDFVFSSHKLDLAEAPEQSMMRAAAAAGSHQWAALTEGYVYHNATGNALTVTPASEITEAAHITPMYDGDDAKGKAGVYQFSVDFTNPAAPTYVAEYTGDITTGVEGIVVDNAAEAVYYDLTGRRVLNPSAGVVIRVQGGKAEKIMIK